jgi:hypothetical protein
VTIDRSDSSRFLATNPSFRVHVILSSVFRNTDLIRVSPKHDSGVKGQGGDM